MAHDVLISYSSQDKLQADAICNRLESLGIRCWIAPRDVGLGEYAESIVEAIDEAKVMVLVFSKNADKSSQVKRELERAVSKGTTIVPVRIEDAEMSKSLEFYVSSMHWLDAITPPLEAHIDRLAGKLKSLLEKEDGQSQSEATRAAAATEARRKATEEQAAAEAKREAEEKRIQVKPVVKEDRRAEAGTTKGKPSRRLANWSAVGVGVLLAGVAGWQGLQGEDIFFPFYLFVVPIIVILFWTVLALTREEERPQAFKLTLVFVAALVTLGVLWRALIVYFFVTDPNADTPAGLLQKSSYMPYFFLLGIGIVTAIGLILRYTRDGTNKPNRPKILRYFVIFSLYLLACRILWFLVDSFGARAAGLTP